jgi:cell division protein FtsB
MRPMKVDLGIWDKLARLIVALLVLAGLVGLVFLYVPGMRKNEQLRQLLHRRQVEVQQQLAESNRLKNEIDALRHDNRALERYARTNLNVARTNETVIRFVEPSTNKSR